MKKFIFDLITSLAVANLLFVGYPTFYIFNLIIPQPLSLHDAYMTKNYGYAFIYIPTIFFSIIIVSNSLLKKATRLSNFKSNLKVYLRLLWANNLNKYTSLVACTGIIFCNTSMIGLWICVWFYVFMGTEFGLSSYNYYNSIMNCYLSQKKGIDSWDSEAPCFKAALKIAKENTSTAQQEI